MARIPTVRNLNRAIPQESGRISTAGAGAGGYIAKGIGDVANALESVRLEEQARKDRVDIAEAEADMTIALTEEESAYDNDPDYGTFTSRFGSAIDKRAGAIASRIKNPEAKALFIAKNRARIAQSSEKLKDFAWNKEKTAKNGELNTRIDQLLKAGMTSGDIAGTVNSAQMLLTSYAEHGYIDQSQDNEMMLKVKERLARGRIGSLDPKSALNELNNKAVKDNLDPDVWLSLKKAKESELKSIEAEERQGVAYSLADNAVDQNWSVGRFMTEARKITDPETRLMAENRFRSLSNIAEGEKDKRQADLYETHYTAMLNGKTFDSFTPSELNQLNPTHRAQLQQFQEQNDNDKLRASVESATAADKSAFEVNIRAMMNGKKLSEFTGDELDAMPYAYRSKLVAYEENRTEGIEKKAEKRVSDAEDEVKKTSEELYESMALQMEYGTGYAEFEPQDLALLTASQRSKLQSIDESGVTKKTDAEKQALTERFEQFALQVEGGKKYSEFTEEEKQSLPLAQRDKLRKLSDALDPDAKPEKLVNDFGVQTRMNTLIANGEWKEAQKFLYANHMKLKSEQRQSYDVAIKKGMANPSDAKSIKSSYTLRQDIAKRFGGEDEETQGLFLEKYDDWYTNFQRDYKREPSYEEANKFKNDLMFEMKDEGWFSKYKDKDELDTVVNDIERKAVKESFANVNARLKASGMPALDMATFIQMRDAEIAAPKPKATGALPVSNDSVTVIGSGSSRTIKYPDGVSKSGGSRSWRNNNPGNIEYGDFAKRNGAIGSDGRFAVFPDKETGDAAKIALLKGKSYKDKSIQDAIARYAPQFENDSAGYAKTIAKAAGVEVSTKLSDLTDEQFKKMVDAMTKVEGWKEGKTVGD